MSALSPNQGRLFDALDRDASGLVDVLDEARNNAEREETDLLRRHLRNAFLYCERIQRLLEPTGASRSDQPLCLPGDPPRPFLSANVHRGSSPELAAVAKLRGLSVPGLELASKRGLLWFDERRGSPVWIITDRARVNAQARRMDGAMWRHIGNKKAWTLWGSQASWPIGAQEAENFPVVILVEGGPDCLAGHHFLKLEGREDDVAVVTMLGAHNDIPEDALLLLAHKRVRIFPHADPAGESAAVRWNEQLTRVGCETDAFRFDGLRRSDGGAVKDLNDLANLHPDCRAAEAANLERILPE